MSTSELSTPALGEVVKDFPEEKATQLGRELRGIAREVVKEMIPETIEAIRHDPDYSQEIAGLVQLLASRSGDAKESALKKALTLYGLALDSIEKGDRLAILNPEDEIVREITGFEVAEPAYSR